MTARFPMIMNATLEGTLGRDFAVSSQPGKEFHNISVSPSLYSPGFFKAVSNQELQSTPLGLNAAQELEKVRILMLM